jgi:hypothetical protein
VRAATQLLCALAASLVLAGSAAAYGGAYEIDGGTPAHRAQIRAALAASTFDWSAIPSTVTVHVVRGSRSLATPGHIWIDPALLEAGIFSWAIVQDEYAHQIDFFLLDDEKRRLLTRLLRGQVWCHGDQPGLPHAAYGCERFTSTLVWAYWPVNVNAYRPRRAADEAAAMAPARFRTLVSQLLWSADAPFVPAVAHVD